MKDRRMLQGQVCLFQAGHYRNNCDKPEKLSRVCVPALIDNVARKLSTSEEQRQNKTCLLGREDYRNGCHIYKNIILLLVLLVVVVAVV
jgi:hypothetical protein